MYSVIFSDLAFRQLEKLDHHLRSRILNNIERCRIRPYSYVQKLIGSPYFRLRVGDYKVIMSIIENELKVLIVEIGHRKNIYKK
mgnify:CR=1 FL=1